MGVRESPTSWRSVDVVEIDGELYVLQQKLGVKMMGEMMRFDVPMDNHRLVPLAEAGDLPEDG